VLVGGTGVISVTSNVAPKEMAGMIAAALASDLATANKLHYQLLPLMQAMFFDTNPVPAKTALARMGKTKTAAVRLPLCTMNQGAEERMQQVMKDCGLL
ncbi:MAG: dihydrodipicolinate synthase family protein, partial [Desulfurivibrio sp.]